MKIAPKEKLLTAIRDVLRGQIYVSRDLALRAFQKSLAAPQQTALWEICPFHPGRLRSIAPTKSVSFDHLSFGFRH
jgi:hypothetical protein